MPKATRTDLIQEMVEELGLQGSEGVPVEIANAVQPVYPLGRFAHIVKATNSTTTGDTTVYTTPSDRDFYLTGIHLAYTKDGTCDNVLFYADAVIGGTTPALVRLESQTTTAGSDKALIQFTFPIKIDRGVNIRMRGAFAAGAMTKSITVVGYLA